MREVPVLNQERRWSARVHMEVQACLYVAGARPVRAIARNISLGGMFLVGPDLIRFEDGVVVSMSISVGNNRADYRIPATVARVADDGIALSFECFDRDTINSLREVLYGARSANALLRSALASAP